MELSARRAVAVFAIVSAFPAAPGLAQTSRPAAVPSPFSLTITAASLAGLPRRTISATDEHGKTDAYSGVSLEDLLVRAGAPHGTAVRGKAMLSYVVVGAADGYHVLFALPELDASYTDHVVLIAEREDGVPLAAQVGPYRLITNFERRDARWVRQVTDVSLSNATVP